MARPVCKEKCQMDQGKTSSLVQTPKGLWLIHKACIEQWNTHAALLREMGI